MTVGVHVCRGNYKGMYLSEGGYDSVAERFFAHQRRSFSSSSTRRAPRLCAAAFRAEGKGVVLGLVSLENAPAGDDGYAEEARR